MNKVYIMSVKFAPGHFSHLLAYYEFFEACNCKPYLLLDKKYDSFINESESYNYIYFDEYLNEAPDILFIYNLSKIDAKIIKKFLKMNPSMEVYFVYHEPWIGYQNCIKDFLRGNESILDTIKSIGRYFFVKQVLKKSKKVILPSEEACKNYQKKCIRFNKNYCVLPLIFTDECKNKIDLKEKKYFSFISTVSNSKNFAKFIEYIKYKAKKNPEFMFQIATRSDISNYLDDELQQLIDNKRLIVNYGHPLSNAEINKAYLMSCCTWVLYKRSTQSGVLCKSFMFGAPVIASDIGSFKEFVNDTNGVILDKDCSFNEIDEAVEKIRDNLKDYSEKSRQTFLNNFSWKCLLNDKKSKKIK